MLNRLEHKKLELECWRVMTKNPKYIGGLTGLLAAALASLTGCGLFSTHQFTSPARDWRVRNGQLMYRTADMRVIGDVVVRYSRQGDFELTFSKGPGIALFTIRQDPKYVSVKSSLAHVSWSGPVEHAPRQLRGWLGLREKIISAPDQKVIRYATGTETFVFRF
jgi:hypothetical protein